MRWRRIAAGASAAAPGGVSDEVFYLHPPAAGQSVVPREPDGTVTVLVEGAFADAFRRLGIIGD